MRSGVRGKGCPTATMTSGSWKSGYHTSQNNGIAARKCNEGNNAAFKALVISWIAVCTTILEAHIWNPWWCRMSGEIVSHNRICCDLPRCGDGRPMYLSCTVASCLKGRRHLENTSTGVVHTISIDSAYRVSLMQMNRSLSRKCRQKRRVRTLCIQLPQ